MLRDRALISEPLDAGPPSSLVVPFVGIAPGAGSSVPKCSTARGLHRLYRLALDTAHVIEIHGYSGGVLVLVLVLRFDRAEGFLGVCGTL